MKQIKLPCYGIVVELVDPDPERPGTFRGGSITSKLGGEEAGEPTDAQFEAACDAITSMVLAHACAGIDISSPAYVEGIETSINQMVDTYF